MQHAKSLLLFVVYCFASDPNGSSLGVFAVTPTNVNDPIPQCAYRLSHVSDTSSPRIGRGRLESYTYFEELGLCYVAGPAALMNAACAACANCTLALDFDKTPSEQHAIALKPIAAGAQLAIDYGRDYRKDMFCCNCGNQLAHELSQVPQPHIPIIPALAPIPFNGLNTAHYIAALNAESQQYYAAATRRKRNKLRETRR
jgi:hypothetical protein